MGDPLLLSGAWAAAVLTLLALGKALQHAFLKAVKMAIREELDGVWKDQDDIEERLSAVELSLQFVREQLHRVEHMMQQFNDR
jgi:hypothetical protein